MAKDEGFTDNLPDMVTDDAVSGQVMPSNEPAEPDKFGQWLTDSGAIERDPDLDPYQRIIDQVLSAATPDDVLTPIEAYKARDMVDVQLVLHGFEMNESSFDVGSPFYASMHVTRADTGEIMVVNCGHKKMIAQLIRLQQLGGYPFNVKVIEQGRSKITGDSMLALAKW